MRRTIMNEIIFNGGLFPLQEAISIVLVRRIPPLNDV